MSRWAPLTLLLIAVLPADSKAQACLGFGPMPQWSVSLSATRGITETTRWWNVEGGIRAIGPLALRVGGGQHGYRVDDGTGRYRHLAVIVPHEFDRRTGAEACASWARSTAEMSGADFTQKGWSLGVGASHLIRIGSVLGLGAWGQLGKSSAVLRTNTLGVVSFPIPLVEERFTEGRVGLSLTILRSVTARVAYGGPIGYEPLASLGPSETIGSDRVVVGSVVVAAPIPYFRRWRFP